VTSDIQTMEILIVSTLILLCMAVNDTRAA
jgi:hypothetical protein